MAKLRITVPFEETESKHKEYVLDHIDAAMGVVDRFSKAFGPVSIFLNTFVISGDTLVNVKKRLRAAVDSDLITNPDLQDADRLIAVVDCEDPDLLLSQGEQQAFALAVIATRNKWLVREGELH